LSSDKLRQVYIVALHAEAELAVVGVARDREEVELLRRSMSALKVAGSHIYIWKAEELEK